MSNVFPKSVPFIQQNGAPIMNGATTGPQLRPQFRRQGSSFGGGGHVAPMAVMVSPNRIDYSVTKGGLRTWAVLFVFIFLCSSLYTIFSAKDLSDLAVDIDGDGEVDIDGEIESDAADEVANQYKKADKDRTPSREYVVHPADETKRAHQKTRLATATADDDIDEDEDKEEEETAAEPTEEQILFAGLRAKIEAKQRKQPSSDRRTDEAETNENDEEEEDASVVPIRQPKRRRNRKKGTVEELQEEQRAEEDETTPTVSTLRKSKKRKVKEEEASTNDDDEEDDEDKTQPQERRSWKSRSKKSRAEIVDSDDEEAIEEEEEEDQRETDEKEQHGTDQDESDAKDQEEEKEEEAKKAEDKTKAEAEKDDTQKDESVKENEEDAEAETRKSRSKKRKMSVQQPSKMCKRKNCPPAYDHTPRMGLLKEKPQSKLSRRNKRYTTKPVEDEDLEDFDEFEETEEDRDGSEVDMNEDEEEQMEELNEIVAVKKGRLNDRTAYKRRAITNRDDHRFREQLDHADHLVEKHEYRAAFAIFDDILRHNPDSPRAHFGKARAFDIRSELNADKTYLDMAINEYQQVLDSDDTPDALFRQAANRLVDRARFRGALHKALVAQRSLIDRYPDEIQLQNDFGLTFLMMGRKDDAQKVFENVLQVYPNNGVAQAYYGYLMKLSGNFEQGVIFMKKGLQAARAVIADPRFYYHLGDALLRLGRKEEAFNVYNIAAKKGLFLSPYQRSLYNYYGLTARPWWSIDQTTYAKYLKNVERQWTIIREEAVNVFESKPELYTAENEQLTIGGQWLALHLYQGGQRNKTNCQRMPKTCDILNEFKVSSNSSKNQMKISLLTSGTRIWPHCGYSNCKLQAHLGLVVPSEARIRVADEIHGWKTGRFIVFDDSFEHELWFDGASANKMRLVLVIDLWHPDVDSSRRYEFSGDL